MQIRGSWGTAIVTPESTRTPRTRRRVRTIAATVARRRAAVWRSSVNTVLKKSSVMIVERMATTASTQNIDVRALFLRLLCLLMNVWWHAE